ncbi:uncharacterized protein H6S33_007573 [Morchella sextelata]|uniref:uncharacterized protein n=1 Tax=Morchella sextelata TaxID=1174677 RepID=UPI001D048365|nr:uncharacterized protein H6S33_007573 [Morchella sextelata]KAH0603914.1 hypothetical protein H6S33_007573 [Morchella sextelata]
MVTQSVGFDVAGAYRHILLVKITELREGLLDGEREIRYTVANTIAKDWILEHEFTANILFIRLAMPIIFTLNIERRNNDI